MICKKCGTQLDDNAVYCYNCGFIFERPRQPQPNANFAPPVDIQPIEQPKKKNTSIWYKVIIPVTAVLVVIAIICGLYAGGAFNSGNSWQVEVPDVIGKTYNKASETLEKKNLHCLISDKVENADIDENNVLSQDPTAKMTAGKGSIVDVVLSAGAGKIYMPDIENYSKDYANDILKTQGFEVEFRDAKGDCDKYAPNSVCDYSIESGHGAYKGETVIVYVKPEAEKQTSKYTMPKIVGMDFDDAQEKLYSDGMYIAIEKYEYNDKISENQITAQSVKENEQVEKGSTVYVTVSLGKEKIYMPDVTYMSEANAKKLLEESGLKVKIEQEESHYIAKDTVIEQKTQAGTQVEKGAEVTLVVSSGYTVIVPDVVGLSEKEAIKRIITSDLAVNVVYEYDINKAQKTVTAQDKQANEKVQIGTVVTIVVNDKKHNDSNTEISSNVSENINKASSDLIEEYVKNTNFVEKKMYDLFVSSGYSDGNRTKKINKSSEGYLGHYIYDFDKDNEKELLLISHKFSKPSCRDLSTLYDDYLDIMQSFICAEIYDNDSGKIVKKDEIILFTTSENIDGYSDLIVFNYKGETHIGFGRRRNGFFGSGQDTGFCSVKYNGNKFEEVMKEYWVGSGDGDMFRNIFDKLYSVYGISENKIYGSKLFEAFATNEWMYKNFDVIDKVLSISINAYQNSSKQEYYQGQGEVTFKISWE